MTEYQKLYSYVITRAVLDLFSATTPSANIEEQELARLEAMQFLTSAGGAWANSRALICDMAGKNETILRARIVAILEGQTNLAALNGHNALNGMTKARAMWLERRDLLQRTATAHSKTARARNASRWAAQLREKDIAIKESRIVEKRAKRSQKYGVMDRTVLTMTEVIDSLTDYIELPA